MREPDLLAALAQSIERARVQRRIDSQPCPKCGGDRLRADFTDADRCHAGGEEGESDEDA